MNLKNTFQNKQFQFHFQKINEADSEKLVTSKKTSFFEEISNNQNEKNKMGRNCTRCLKFEAEISCLQCKCFELCMGCDNLIHGFGKFLNHNRTSIESLKQKCENILQKNSNTSIEVEAKVKENNEEISFAIVNISQTWNKIISQISTKFQQLIDQVQDKRKYTLQKIQRKKQQQIQNYLSLSKQFSSLSIQSKNISQNNPRPRKQSKCITQDIQIKIKRIQTEYMEQQIQKKYKLFSHHMKNIETELCKLDIKNVISKIYEDNTKLINKSIRTPQMVESCTSIGTSPNTKTPVTLKSHMSQSTMDIDSSDKLTDKHKHTLKISYNQKQLKMLSRVRSQKLFCKSPTNNLQKQIKQKTFILQK